MSRVSDNLVLNSLNPYGDITAAVGGGCPISGLTKHRAMIWNTVVSYGTGVDGSALDIKLQESPKPTPNAVSSGLIGTPDGSDAVGVGQTYTALAIPFTANKDYTAYSVKLGLIGVGVPEGFCGCGICVDNAGDPDTTAFVTGASEQYTTFAQFAGSLDTDNYTELEMKFVDGIDLTSGTDYWAVFTCTDCVTGSVNVAYNTVVGTGDAKVFTGGAWANYGVNKAPYFKIMECVFTDISGASMTVVEGIMDMFMAPNVFDYTLEDKEDVIRAYFTNTNSALWVVSSSILAGDARLLPTN